MRREGTARRKKLKKTTKLWKFYNDRYPDLARVCAEQMFKKQTYRTFSLLDSHNLQHGLCSFIAAWENTRGLFFRGGGWVGGGFRKSMFSLSTCSLCHTDTAKRQKCFRNPNLLLQSCETANFFFLTLTEGKKLKVYIHPNPPPKKR